MSGRTATFQRGSSVYTCASCGKETRETGDGESRVELCRNCHYQAGLENEHLDGIHDERHADCHRCQAVAIGGHPVDFLRGRGYDVWSPKHLDEFPDLLTTTSHWLTMGARVAWEGRWDRETDSFLDTSGPLPDKRPAVAPSRPKGRPVKLTLSPEQLASDEWTKVCQWIADSSGAKRTINGTEYTPGVQ